MFGLRNSLISPLTPLSAKIRIQELEARITPAATNVGQEFRANTSQANSQRLPAVAVQADGNYVIAWESDKQDGSARGVFAQRYRADGSTIGNEFRVNQFTKGEQYAPKIATGESGNFIITWMSLAQDGSDWGVYARLYDRDGNTLVNEFRVNQRTANYQGHPTAAMDALGNMIITWTSRAQDGSGFGVYARCYNQLGVAIGNEFQVNQFTRGDQAMPQVAMGLGGVGIIVWNSVGQDGSGSGIYGRWLDSNGAFLSDEFRINTITAGDQTAPAIAMSSTNTKAVVTWMGKSTSGNDIYFRVVERFSSPNLPDALVNTTTIGTQNHPTVAMDDLGRFTIAWESQQTGRNGFDILGQRYSSNNVRSGTEFLANTTVIGNQRLPNIGMNGSGSYILSWMDDSPALTKKAHNEDIGVQRFQNNSAPSITSESFAFNVFGANQGNFFIDLTEIAWDSDDSNEGLTFSILSIGVPELFPTGYPYTSGSTLYLSNDLNQGFGSSTMLIMVRDPEGLTSFATINIVFFGTT